MSKRLRETVQTAFNVAITPACLCAVLVLWWLASLARALRESCRSVMAHSFNQSLF